MVGCLPAQQELCPRDWKLQCSLDNQIWVDVHEVINEINWLDGEQRTYRAQNLDVFGVSGITTRGLNAPVSKNIFVHNQENGDIVGTTISDQQGKFEVLLSGQPDVVFIRAVDPSGELNTIVQENIIPTRIEDL